MINPPNMLHRNHDSTDGCRQSYHQCTIMHVTVHQPVSILTAHLKSHDSELNFNPDDFFLTHLFAGARRARSHHTAGDRGLGRRVSEGVAQGRQFTVNIGCTAGRARHLASKRNKVAASAHRRPPISRARTVSRQRLDLHSSGYVRSLARLAAKAAPAVRPPALRGRPAAVRGETSVVSTASWAPPHNGRPLAMTSMRRSSWRAGSTFTSPTSTFRALHTREVCTATASGRSQWQGQAKSARQDGSEKR